MRTLLLLLIIVAITGLCFAQDVNQAEIEEKMKRAEEKIRLANEKIEISLQKMHEYKMNDAYMGVYYDEITLSKARELDYKKFYGIVVDRVSNNSPAKYFRILEDDIIMQIGDKQVMDEDSFSKIISTHYPGDKTTLVIFRGGEEINMEFVFGMRGIDFVDFLEGKDKELDKKIEKEIKKKHSVGGGGGSWIPVYFTPELDDVNDLIQQFGFTEIDDDGIFLNGGLGKGNVGKGFFLGGMGAGYSKELSYKNKHMNFSVGYGGVTLDKRYAITENFVTSVGFMLGWGGYGLEITNTTGNYDWDNLDEDLTNPNSENISTAVKLKKEYILFQPKAMLMYRILPWLGIRGEFGYMLDYSYHKGWYAENIHEDIEIKNSPDTEFRGMTFSVGPWFGF